MPEPFVIFGEMAYFKFSADPSLNDPIKKNEFTDSLFASTFGKDARMISGKNACEMIVVKGNQFKILEGISRPQRSAEDLLSEMSKDDPSKEKYAILLASIFEDKGADILENYSESGKLNQDTTLLSNSILLLNKAIQLYGDSTLAANAIKRKVFLSGLKFGLSDKHANLDSARVYFEQLNKAYPKASFPLNALAELLNRESETEKAKEYLKQAVRLTPRWTVPKKNLGQSFFLEIGIP
jgi:tetratricopeptide (TPR) repeat protein